MRNRGKPASGGAWSIGPAEAGKLGGGTRRAAASFRLDSGTIDRSPVSILLKWEEWPLATLRRRIHDLVRHVHRRRPVAPAPAFSASDLVAELSMKLKAVGGEIAWKPASAYQAMTRTLPSSLTERLKETAHESARILREEMASAAATATQGMRIEVAGAAQRILAQLTAWGLGWKVEDSLLRPRVRFVRNRR